MAPQRDVDIIAEAVMRYLSNHPRASDTVEGIVSWWLPAAGIVATIDRTEAALDRLVEQGVLSQRRSPDGRVLYGHR